MKNLVKRTHPFLVLSDGSTVTLSQQSIYQTLFHEPFPARDAMQDVRTLRRVFDSRLNISEDMLIENMSTTQYAENDMDTLIVATNSSRRSEELFIIQQTRNFPLSNILLKK